MVQQPPSHLERLGALVMSPWSCSSSAVVVCSRRIEGTAVMWCLEYQVKLGRTEPDQPVVGLVMTGPFGIWCGALLMQDW